jgi:hypothetical protein
VRESPWHFSVADGSLTEARFLRAILARLFRSR